MLRIKNAEDFGLGFNCMTRLYMANHEEEILDDMFQVCKEYLKWFSFRTIVCSLRDLEAELLVKEYNHLAEKYSEVQGGIVTWLGKLLGYDKLSSQKDCRQMYYQIIGVERYVSSTKDNMSDAELLTEIIVTAKRTITEKLWYFFELEEGDKYEKVSEGVYQKRCND